MTTAITLTDVQRRVVEASPQLRIVVEAGAGTGKTVALLERVRWLLTNCELARGRILALSFSRAAVEVMRRRLEAAGIPPIDVRTIDSFASEMAGDGSREEESFDDRIRRVCDAMESGEATPWLETMDHILVDEIQDLVGIRADFIKALLSKGPGGFTLFGDTAQSIYQFASPDQAQEPNPVLQWVRSAYVESHVETTFDECHRATTAATRAVLRFQSALRGQVAEATRHEIQNHVHRLPAVPSLAAARPMLERSDGSQSAVLTRSNGEALAISAALDRLGIKHDFRGYAEHRAAPRWLACVFHGSDRASMTHSELADRMKQVPWHNEAFGAQALQSLIRCARTGGSQVDLRKIAARVQAKTLPEILYTREGLPSVVSTIHRSKGLEFERVVLVVSERQSTNADGDEEARIAFVGLTRARCELFRFEIPTRPPTFSARWQRWVYEEFRGRSRILTGVEITPSDIDLVHSTAGTDDPTGDSEHHYLATSVRSGDPVNLVRISGDKELPRYAMLHEGREIGRTSNEWADLIAGVFPSRRVGYPTTFSGLYVDTVETVVGSVPHNLQSVRFQSGLRLRPRVRGFAKLQPLD